MAGIAFGFVLLLLLPICVSYYIYKRKKSTVLFINQNKIRDPRYFGKSFSKMIENSEIEKASRTMNLSKKEKILKIGKLGFTESEYEQIIICKKSFHGQIPRNIRFLKEIYAKKSIALSGDTALRAIYAKEMLIIGDHTYISRWADAEGNVMVGNHCSLGMSTSSKTQLVVGKDCMFHRLYAPVLVLGRGDYEEYFRRYEQLKKEIYNLPVERKKQWNAKYITDHMKDETGVIPFTIVTKRNLIVTENLIIRGDIRSEKGVKLSEGSVICGNVFAERDVYLGKNAIVLGIIFTQGSVIMEAGAVVGREGEITSVIARESICINGTVKIYGYISCENEGSICEKSSQEYGKAQRDRHLHKKEKRPVVRGLQYLAAVIIISMLCMGAFLINNYFNAVQKANEAEAESNAERYRTDGLPKGQQLETTPVSVTDKYVIFKDRILKRPMYDQEGILLETAVIDSIMDMVPAQVKCYFMLAPLRIQYEKGMEQYCSITQTAESLYVSKLEEDAIYCDVRQELPDLKGHYLFFRTEEYWTAEGAYYGANAFLKKTGEPLPPLSEYHEDMYGDFSGTLLSTTGQKPYESGEQNDKLYFYRSASFDNHETLYKRDDNKKYFSSIQPILSQTRIGLSSFVGGSSFSHAILMGNVKNEKTLLLIGDTSAAVMAPYFTDRYQYVYVINQLWYDQSTSKFSQIFKDYNVTDLLFVESLGNLGNEINRDQLADIVRDNM